MAQDGRSKIAGRFVDVWLPKDWGKWVVTVMHGRKVQMAVAMGSRSVYVDPVIYDTRDEAVAAITDPGHEFAAQIRPTFPYQFVCRDTDSLTATLLLSASGAIMVKMREMMDEFKDTEDSQMPHMFKDHVAESYLKGAVWGLNAFADKAADCLIYLNSR